MTSDPRDVMVRALRAMALRHEMDIESFLEDREADDTTWLHAFVRESNAIEGIYREPRGDELHATAEFIELRFVRVENLVALVSVYQPDARLRKACGMDVRVGDHIAPRGGPEIVPSLQDILSQMPNKTPWQTHVDYETLHPFTDGNGRSGRALWAWHMRASGKANGLLFLHAFYYQTLSASRPATSPITQEGST